jgi:glycosyltransferase involved in cell wall biosynthesis
VSRETLQRRYPPGAPDRSVHYSSIHLPAECIVAQPRVFSQPATRLIIVATLATPYKGVDTLLKSLPIVNRSDLHLTIVGDGRIRPQLEQMARDLAISSQVTFTGKLPAGQPVFDALDQAELFVLPSRGEGLPRAMIEAMARALPCIGTPVAGVPELLEPEHMFPQDDPPALADAIIGMIDRPERLTAASARNLEVASEYEASVLTERRNRLYGYVRDACEGARAGRR